MLTMFITWFWQIDEIQLEQLLKHSRYPGSALGFIIDEHFGMQKLSAKLMPKCLNGDENWNRVDSFNLILQHFERYSNSFLERFDICDETLLHDYDYEIKQHSFQWWYSSSPHPKKFKTHMTAGKSWSLFLFLFFCFWIKKVFWWLTFFRYTRQLLHNTSLNRRTDYRMKEKRGGNLQ